jgi:hypothetical protein
MTIVKIDGSGGLEGLDLLQGEVDPVGAYLSFWINHIFDQGRRASHLFFDLFSSQDHIAITITNSIAYGRIRWN